jgi:hypothetical protein
MGSMYCMQDTYTGESYPLGDYPGGEGVQLVIRPELGVMYMITKEFGFTVSASFYYGLGSRDLPSQSFFTIDAGVVFTR